MKRSSADDSRSGMILVTALWTIALLSALAMAAATTFRGFAGIIAIDRDRARADALLEAGLELSAGIISKFGDKTPLTEQETIISLSTGSVRLHLTDEGGRIDVNKAPVQVLASMLRSAGAGDTSDLIARAIDAWRTRDQADQSASPVQQPTSQPAANAAARQANAPPPKDDNFRSFTDLRQLAQVPGMTPEVLDAILPLATVFGDDKVNALTASADVLAALPNVGPGQVSAFLGARDRSGLAGDRLLQMLGPAKDYVKAEGRPAAAVILTALLPDGYTAAAKAVVTVLPDDKQPYRVLAWTPLRVSARGRARMAERLEEDR